MLVVSAVHVAVGWVWHTAYRIRWHWRLKREGALMAAAAVVAFGAVDGARSMMRLQGGPPAVVASTTETVTAPATPVLTEPKVMAVAPSVDAVAPEPVSPIENVAAMRSPDLDNVAPEDQLPPGPDDPIAAKIKERLGDPVSTASIPDQAPIKPKPVKTVRTTPVKAPVAKVAERGDATADANDEPAKLKRAKSARAPATKPAVAAAPADAEKPVVAKAPVKKITPKKPKSNETEQ